MFVIAMSAFHARYGKMIAHFSMQFPPHTRFYSKTHTCNERQLASEEIEKYGAH